MFKKFPTYFRSVIKVMLKSASYGIRLWSFLQSRRVNLGRLRNSYFLNIPKEKI